MKRYAFILLLLLSGCKVLKQSQKTKDDISSSKQLTEQKDITTSQSKVTTRKREGGQLITDIIPLEERPRDENGNLKELIQTLKDGGLTKTIYYRPDGSATVNCDTADILERIEETLTTKDKSIIKRLDNFERWVLQKEKEKEESISPITILYFMIGLAIVFGVGLLIVFRQLKSYSKALELVK